MAYDCIIIGGGLAGLTCGIKCCREGLRTAIISAGANSLHFSSGSIDLYGYTPEKTPITRPLEYIETMAEVKPDHPYSKIGPSVVAESIEFFIAEAAVGDITLHRNGKENHFHVTGIGTLKPTYLSQASVFNERIRTAWESRTPIAILNFEGYRDYYAEIAVEQLKRQPLFSGNEIITGRIRIPRPPRPERNPHEFRSIDLARIFETEKYVPRIAGEINSVAGNAGIVCLPSFIGIRNFGVIHKRLEELTGRIIYEVPSLPPSIMGMRIDDALKRRFAALGGEFSIGDTVTGGEIINGAVDHVHTRSFGTTRHQATSFVLATGSFFSNGLRSEFNRIEEPVLKLSVNASQKRSDWYAARFFEPSSHPFLEYGVRTDTNLKAIDANGNTVDNLYCAGAILGGYNPIREASGGGVAIASGYHAALMITGKGAMRQR
ncbi:MAG: glycerol-3-phosphate dehydrogenase subunit GlpB [Spirochaetes bacterium]|nr:glycerol-3-phosphate dehydrogenase subunit GlpB [Spirochaetota bacterium]